MRRAHPTAVRIEQNPGQQVWLIAGLSIGSIDAVLGEDSLHIAPQRLIDDGRTAETSVSTPVSPALPGPEVVEAPFWARKHRRFHNEGSPKPNTFVRPRATAVATNLTGRHELSQRIVALNELTAQQLRDEWRRLRSMSYPTPCHGR
jgi:hypothetical protein